MTPTHLDAETVSLPMQHRALSVRPETFDNESLSVDVVWSTGARVVRLHWNPPGLVEEELDMREGAVDLSRLNAGAPVLDTHQADGLDHVIGAVVPGSARLERGQGIARLRLSSRPEIAGLVRDIAEGIIRNISIGYTVEEYEIEKRPGQRDLFVARRWTPHEISFVPVPADAGAQVRGADAGQGGFPCVIRRMSPALQESPMSNPPLAGAQAPAADPEPLVADAPVPAAPPPPPVVRSERVREIARIARLSPEETVELLARHADQPFTEDTLSREAIRLMAAREPAMRLGGATVQVDEREKRFEAAAAAVLHRLRPQGALPAGAEHYRGMRMLDIVRDLLAASGVRVRGLTANETARLAFARSGTHTSFDFPELLANVAGKTLRQAYEAEPRKFQPFCRVVEIVDFKEVSRIQIGGQPALVLTPEGAEIEHATIGESAEKYRLNKYAAAVPFTREMLINDDLSAFDRAITGFGASAAWLENHLVFRTILVDNPVMGDGVQLFHANHGNLTSTGTAITVASLGAGRAMMEKQKADNGMPLAVEARFLIVGPDKRTEAEQHVANILPNAAGSVNPFTEFQVISSSHIPGNTWFLAARPAVIDTIEVAYLEGQPGPVVDQLEDFDTWGVKVRCVHVVAAKAIDWRGLYRNNGA